MIKMSTDEVRISAQKYTAGSEQVTAVLSSLTSEQDVLRSNWEGNAFTAFDEQFKALEPKIKQFAELLLEINNQLNSAAEYLENADSELGRGIYPG